MSAAAAVIRIGLTPVILDDQTTFLNAWRRWLEGRLGQPVRFVQRAKYRDITDLLLGGYLDAAWVCGYPYVQHRHRLRLLAVPEYKGVTTYHSYIIARAGTDQRITAFKDLRGGVFAFSDPDSNSGYLYPSYRLLSITRDPDHFFRRSFFTWAHRNTVDAVASGLADAGAVDSYVWESYRHLHPEHAGETRVIERSPPFGFPPLVTRARLDASLASRLARVLHTMEADADGRRLLSRLFLDRFVEPRDADYDGIAEMAAQVEARRR